MTTLGSHVLSSEETLGDGKRLALLEAKRKALEQVGSLIESVVAVRNETIAQDISRLLSAGILETIESRFSTRLEDSKVTVSVTASFKIDSEEVRKQIAAYHHHEEEKEEARQTTENIRVLQEQLKEVEQELASASDYRQPGVVSRRRAELLKQLAVEDLLTQVWPALIVENAVGGVRSTPESRERARSLLDEVRKLDPNNPRVFGYRGTILSDEGKIDLAIEEYRAGLRVDPDSYSLHHNLGRALVLKGDLDGALKEYRQALEIRPESSLTHNAISAALGKKGDIEGSMVEAREALRLDQDNADAHNNVGFNAQLMGDLDGAIAEFKEAVRLDPKNGNARINLGRALIQRAIKNQAVTK